MPPNSGETAGQRTKHREATGRVVETFWMPQPQDGRGQGLPLPDPMTAREATTVRRLRKTRRKPASGLRERMATRRRRRVLDQLSRGDLRNLAQLLMRLGL